MQKTVLIFDDDAEILKICAIILEAKGFRVITQNNCSAVIDKILDCEADVVMMDNRIPDTGGVEATRIIKQTEATKHIPVVFSSASTNVVALSQQAGAEYYLAKPFDMSALEDMVSQAVETRMNMTS